MGINFNDITFFKTAQGSKYIRLPDGRLRRWKSSHANTGGEDMGLHSWSTQSIFVDPKYEYPANSIQYLVGKGYKVALSKDAEGKMFPMIVDNGQWRPATWGDAYTVYARQNPDMANKVLSWKYSKEPVVGYHVVDFDLKGGDRGTEIKGYHFGSPVSEIGSLSDEDKKLFFPSQSNLQESIRRVLREETNSKKELYYEFKCTDADEDGIFYDTPFGEIDSTEFAQFIDDMEDYEISQEEFQNKFNLSSEIVDIINNSEDEWLQFFDKSYQNGYVVIFDGDIHYIYSV